MKKLLFLLAGIALLSCRNEGQEPKVIDLPAGTTLKLQLSGTIPEGEEATDESKARALDLYINNAGKVRATLKGKTTVKVKTYLYSGTDLVWSENADWKVINDGASLRYEGDITTSAPMQVGNTKLVAILTSDSSPLSEPTIELQRQVTPIIVSDGTSKQSIDIPYVLESNITVTSERGTNIGTLTSNQRFKPYGNILHVTLENTVNTPITVTNLRITSYNTAYTLDPAQLAQGLKKKNDITTLSPINIPLSQSVTVPANAKSDKSLLLWVGSLSTAPSINIGYSDVPRSLGYYTTYLPTRTSYDPGKVYNIKLKIREAKNPLSYFAAGFVDKESRSIYGSLYVSPLPETARYWLGRFSELQLKGQRDNAAEHDMFYPATRVYTPIKGYQIPTTLNIASIGLAFPRYVAVSPIYWPRISYVQGSPAPAGEHIYSKIPNVSAKIGDLRIESTWEILRQVVYSPYYDSTSDLNRRDKDIPYKNYLIGYIKEDSQTGTKDYSQSFAFRYSYEPGPSDYRFVISCVFVGNSISSIEELKNKPETFWRQGENRVVPAITSKEQSPGSQFSNPNEYSHSDVIVYLGCWFKTEWENEYQPLNEYATFFGSGDGGYARWVRDPLSPRQASVWPYKIDY